jgi:hypothetical protein
VKPSAGEIVALLEAFLQTLEPKKVKAEEEDKIVGNAVNK